MWYIKAGGEQLSCTNQSSLAGVLWVVSLNSFLFGIKAVKAHWAFPELNLFPRSKDLLNVIIWKIEIMFIICLCEIMFLIYVLYLSPWLGCQVLITKHRKKCCLNVTSKLVKFRKYQRKIKQGHKSVRFPDQNPSTGKGFRVAFGPSAASVQHTLQKATVFELSCERH